MSNAYSGQDTRTSTQSTATNNQVGAAEGSFAVGANSSVHVESSDGKVVEAASNAVRHTARDALDMADTVSRTAVKGVESAAYEGQVTARQVTRDALDFGSAVSLQTIKSAENTVSQANSMLSKSFETYATKIQNNAGDAPQTVYQDAQKTVVYAAGIGAVALIAYALINKKAA